MKQLSFLFTGDVMAHANQLQAARNETTGKYDFSGNFRNILKYIRKVDAAVCNLETTIAGGEPRSYPRFNTPSALVDAIADAGFTCVATANNHSYDSNKEGIIKTRKALEERSLKVIGTRKNAGEKAYAVLDVKGVKVGLLNYTYETAAIEGKRTLNNRPMEPDTAALLNSFSYESIEEDLKKVEAEIAAARQDGAEILIVYYHWGNEYERYSNVFQKYVAWRTAHMGVDAIIGSHAHVMQELGGITVVDGGKEKLVPVFYGLGNYIWGAPPIYERETVLNNILALLDIAYNEETGEVQVTPGWVPLYIAQKDNVFETIDMRALPREEYACFEKRFGIHPEKVLSQIQETVENRVHPAPINLQFRRLFRMKTGERRSLLKDFLPEKEYTAFRSEDAIIASVTQNGYVIGNSAGYVGITAIDSDGTETALLVKVLQGAPSKFPILVNEQNYIRDIYQQPNKVDGKLYEFSPDLRLCKPAAEAWKAMCLAAREDGVYLKMTAATRTKTMQAKRRSEYAAKYGDAAVRRRYHTVGCSEHHLGTALDVNGGTYNGVATPKAKAFQWVQKNCGRFGFVARRFTAKVEHVAYIHLRYLEDQKLVQLLNEKEITIEEYLTRIEQYQN